MKKQYIIPTLDVVKIQPYLLQVTSPNGQGAIDPSEEEDAGGVASRTFSLGLWGDDDD